MTRTNAPRRLPHLLQQSTPISTTFARLQHAARDIVSLIFILYVDSLHYLRLATGPFFTNQRPLDDISDSEDDADTDNEAERPVASKRRTKVAGASDEGELAASLGAEKGSSAFFFHLIR